jgi:hypothetical protein
MADPAAHSDALAAVFGQMPAYAPHIASYEDRLDQNPEWALSEGSRFFEEKSALQDALRRVARRLDELNVPYAVAGGMALFKHGFRRFTEDVDILVNRAAIKTIHRELDGRGYLPPFAGSKNLRDTELGVRIEFIITGGYPGDGQPKPVAFPDPATVAVELDGVKYVNLPTLVELKLASGMTNARRGRDLDDVQDLIETLNLSADFADRLNPYVHDKYRELWTAVRGAAKRFMLLCRKESLPADLLDAMRADGVVEEPAGDELVHLTTTDPDVARKYDMHDEAEFLGQDDDRSSVSP